jgi:hypothetical protein
MRCEGVDWIHLAQARDLCSSCEHGNERSVSIKGEECLG